MVMCLYVYYNKILSINMVQDVQDNDSSKNYFLLYQVAFHNLRLESE